MPSEKLKGDRVLFSQQIGPKESKQVEEETIQLFGLARFTRVNLTVFAINNERSCKKNYKQLISR